MRGHFPSIKKQRFQHIGAALAIGQVCQLDAGHIGQAELSGGKHATERYSTCRLLIDDEMDCRAKKGG